MAATEEKRCTERQGTSEALGSHAGPRGNCWPLGRGLVDILKSTFLPVCLMRPRCHFATQFQALRNAPVTTPMGTCWPNHISKARWQELWGPGPVLPHANGGWLPLVRKCWAPVESLDYLSPASSQLVPYPTWARCRLRQAGGSASPRGRWVSGKGFKSLAIVISTHHRKI